MGKKLTFALSAIVLAACANVPAVGGDREKPHGWGKGTSTGGTTTPTPNPPTIGKDVEVRTIDAETLRKLGLTKEDALFAMTGDAEGNDKGILFLADGMSFTPTELRPNSKLVNAVQIFALRNSPVCYYFQTLLGTRFYVPRPDCPH